MSKKLTMHHRQVFGGPQKINSMKASVYSCHMDNIPEEVLDLQKECINKFLPKDWDFQQIKYKDSHGHAMQRCTNENPNEVTIFLDIDCIPLSHEAFRFLYDDRWTCVNGALVGCAQRANHINNNKHIYAGPFCMSFLNETYKALGSPTFLETTRGDVGEELTYRWQENHKSVYLLWPSDVRVPKWNLFDNFVQFGLGTTYEGLFYHAFCARGDEGQALFTDKCRNVLGSKAMVLA